MTLGISKPSLNTLKIMVLSIIIAAHSIITLNILS
jgi:hypothetical protein